MAFCPTCGAQAEGRFCAKCGSSIAAAAPSAPAGAPYAGSAAPGGASAYTANATPGAQPYAAPAAQSGGLTDNLAGALCYLAGFITGILFLVIAPYNQSKFVRFHAFQSIFLFIAWIAFWVVETFVSFMLPWGLTMILGLVNILIVLAFFGLWLFLMYKAYNNEKFKLPVIGDLAEKQA